MLLRKYHNVLVPANDTASYTQSLQPHRKLILTAILLNILQINLKMIHIQKMEKNKHTESIAKTIQVPHRPQQIQICNLYFGAFLK